MCVWLQQTKTKYEIEAEKRELARLLEKRTQEVENLTGKTSGLHTHTQGRGPNSLDRNSILSFSVNFPLCVQRM